MKTDFVISSAKGARNNKISFLKARLRRAFKKLIFIIIIHGFTPFSGYLSDA
ncbi:hypothetical protein HCU40_22000 (plasmid) [Pseudanabaena biceps]|nr:hypothetical protein [Pseudanabaena biceps]